jgi:polyisoprenoid-binding protein YceI
MNYSLLRTFLAALTIAGFSINAPQAPTADRVSTAGRSSGPLVLSIDAAQSTVHWSLDSSVHTVHGTFRVKRGTLSVDPASGKATGEIVVDAASGESGNDSRDRKMHTEVLESARFAEVTFRPDHVEGTISAQGTSNVKIHGVFSLHGLDHEFTAPAQAVLDGQKWKGSATFDVPFVDWKLKNPSNFLLKVKHEVNVQLELSGTLQSSQH